MLWVERVGADGEFFFFERLHHLLEVRKGLSRKEADVDHVGPVVAVPSGLLKDLFHGQRGGVGDLGEDVDVVAGKVGFPTALAEKGGKVLEIDRPPNDRHPKFF